MKVNTLIIGAGRSGTTTLYEYLKNHKDICFSSLKEIHYFTFQDLYERGDTYLNSFFQHKKSENILVTADTYSMIDKEAPKRILAYNPRMKFIVILRDPVERAYSNFQYARNYGYEKEARELAEKMIQVVNTQLSRNHNFWESYSADNEVLNCPSNYIWDCIIAKLLIDLNQIPDPSTPLGTGAGY